MRAPVWERLARKNAEYYIATWNVDYSRPEVMERFFESGRREATSLLEEAAPWLTRTDAAMEIGCGVGRLTLPVSERFGKVVAVDVSPTMLTRLRGNCERFGRTNIDPVLSDEIPADLRVDFVYSRIVLQHIESTAEIERYLRTTSRVLRPDGVAHLQFDTRPVGALYRVRNALPDWLLPATWRRGIRRVRRSRASLVELCRGAGLLVTAEHRANTAEHVFLLRPRFSS